MIIDFSKIDAQQMPNFKGGEKFYEKKAFEDEHNNIMLGKLVPGASIGIHTHEGNSEVIFIIRPYIMLNSKHQLFTLIV